MRCICCIQISRFDPITIHASVLCIYVWSPKPRLKRQMALGISVHLGAQFWWLCWWFCLLHDHDFSSDFTVSHECGRTLDGMLDRCYWNEPTPQLRYVIAWHYRVTIDMKSSSLYLAQWIERFFLLPLFEISVHSRVWITNSLFHSHWLTGPHL